MHPLLEFCYLKIYLYYLQCYGYILLIYVHALMTYIPILRTLIYITEYISRIVRDALFHARIKLKHWHREWRDFRREVLRFLRDAIVMFAVAPGASRLQIPDPPAPHLLLSNEAPNDTEIDLAMNAIQEAKAERLRFKAELLLGKAANRRDLMWDTIIRHKISYVSTFVDQHEGIVSPLRRLPPEILQHIFLFAVPICPNVPRSWTSASDVPWVLGQVCRSWRRSALSYSLLWSGFPRLDLKTTKSRNIMQLAMVEELLKRSGIAPLTIYVNALPESYHLQNHPTLDRLIKSSERWVVAAFGLSINLTCSLEVVKGRLPFLEKLFIHDHIELGARSLQLDMFKTAPRLRVVNTSTIHYFGLPVEQLVSCKVEIAASEFLKQVLHCPSPCPLENLTLLEVLDPQFAVPVTLPRLVNLAARFWTTRDTSVLRMFTLPSIEYIKIVCSEPGVLLPNLMGMLSNCKESTLKRLWYRIPNAEEEGFSDLLALVPTLVELDANLPKRVHIKNLVDGFMHRNLVPQLETCRFYIKKEQVGGEIADVLNDLAESRCEIMSPDTSGWCDGGGEDPSAFRFPDEVRPLKSLLVYSEDREAIYLLNGSVNGYTVTPVYETLVSASTQLLKAVDLARKGTKIDFTELDVILDTIETISVQNVEDIYFSGLHLSLKRLRDWNKRGNGNYTQRAQHILERWEPLFKTNWGTRKWGMKGCLCVVYIGRKDPLRASSRNMEIAYEVNPIMTFLEALWPRTTLRDFA